MRVYRIQRDEPWRGSHDHTGRGPYRASDDIPCTHKLDGWAQNRPVPALFLQHPQYQTERYRSGFASVAQLLQWFGPIIKELKRERFYIARYNVPSEHVVICDAYQVAFVAEHAERIDA